MKKRVLQSFLCLTVVFLLLQSAATLKQSKNDIEQTYENVLHSCVRIQGNGHYGSGNILKISNEEMVIVTNKHMLAYMDENSYVTFFDGTETPASTLYISDNLDVGFLCVERDSAQEKKLSYRSVHMDTDAYRALKAHDTFFMIDIASDLENPQRYSGEVIDKNKYLEDYQTEMFYGDAYGKPGMSGCGLFDARGNYIGMLSGATPYVEIAAVGLDKILAEYEKIK